VEAGVSLISASPRNSKAEDVGYTLFFLGSKALMAVHVDSTPNFAFQRSEPVLDPSKYLLSPLAALQHDVSTDGQRFLVAKPVAESDECES
jgi:hypothetical protein